MKDVVGILTTSKLPVAKVTKGAKTTPPKLSKSTATTGVMATEETKLSTHAITC